MLKTVIIAGRLPECDKYFGSLALRRQKALHRYMSIFSYRTITQPSEALFKEKGSRFLAFAYPVDSEDGVKDRLHYLRKKYFDATHHCYAYVLGADRTKYRAVDDGEPSHSAGDPILGQIKSRELTNVLVVVVRYFGGTKLGVGGLVQAYKAAAEEALRLASVVTREVVESLELTFDYSATPEVMKMIKDYGLEIRDQEYGEFSVMKVDVPVRELQRLLERLTLLQQLKEKITYKVTK